MTSNPSGPARNPSPLAASDPTDPEMPARAGAGAGPPTVHTLSEAQTRPFDPAAGAPGGRGAARASLPHIEGFEIVRELASGGMGVVYEGRQHKPSRRVAIKVIKAGVGAGADFLQRFELETYVLGLLQHPCIARIYSAGTCESESGLMPYLVMEYIQGEPLGRYVHAHNPPTRRILEIMAEVCEGVHHAHQKGVIHRDLKPDNILVEPGGRPRILDFGIARLSADDQQAPAMETRVGILLGTLPYMSPEQLMLSSGELDIRTDVYSLGVILFQLLTGRMPHDIDGKTMVEAAVRICENDAVSPSAVDSGLKGDVETILLKALERDRERRYPSAQEFGADIRRYLADEPIQARPPSTFYLAAKFARRNKGLVAGLAGVFIALVAGIAMTTRQAGIAASQRDAAFASQVRAEEESRRAERLRREAEAARDESEAARRSAVEAQDRADRAAARAQAEARTSQQVTSFLVEIFQGANPWRNLGREITALELLDSGAQRIYSELGGQPGPQTWLLAEMADVYARLGNPDKGQPLIEDALRIAREAYGPESLEAARMEDNVAKFHMYWRQDFATAAPLVEHAYEVKSRHLSEDDDELAQMKITLASVLVFRREGGGRESKRRAADLAEQAYDTYISKYGPDDARIGGVLIPLAGTLAGNPETRDRAEELYRKGLEFHERVTDPNDPYLSNIYIEFAAFIGVHRHNYEEAALYTRKSLELRDRVFGPEHVSTQQAAQALAMALLRLGELEESKRIRERYLKGGGRRIGAGSGTAPDPSEAEAKESHETP